MAAETAREKYSLEQIIFVPTGIPPHKEPDMITDFWHRHLMVVLAVLGNPYFKVSSLEYERGGITYTVDTMRQLRQIYDEDTTDLYFITGVDTILDVFGWREPKELFSLCKFIAAARPGYDLRIVKEVLGSTMIMLWASLKCRRWIYHPQISAVVFRKEGLLSTWFPRR